MSITFKALVISLAVAFFTVIGNSFFAPHYIYDASFDPQKATTMTMEAAQEYIHQHAIKTGTTDYLIQAIQYPSYLFRLVAPYFIASLFSCLTLALWTKKKINRPCSGTASPSADG